MKIASHARFLALAAAAALAPSLASAHPGLDHVHGLVSGIEHPLFGVDHLLAMVAVGLIAARTGGRGLLLVPLSFVSAMIVGALLGVNGLGLPSVETGIALSLVVFGAMLSLARPLPLSAALPLTAAFGLFHGNAHGLEIPETAGGLAYGLGFVLATATLHAAGVFGAFRLDRWQRAIRAAGVATALVGVGFAAQII